MYKQHFLAETPFSTNFHGKPFQFLFAFSLQSQTGHQGRDRLSCELLRSVQREDSFAMLQHELFFASSLTSYRHRAGPCTDQPCRTHTRHKTQTKSFALIISTEFGQGSQSRFCLQVFKVKGALGFTGCLRGVPIEASKTDRISWGREGKALAAAGGRLCAAWVGSQSSL